jgi:hypothetical protein
MGGQAPAVARVIRGDWRLSDSSNATIPVMSSWAAESNFGIEREEVQVVERRVVNKESVKRFAVQSTKASAQLERFLDERQHRS